MIINFATPKYLWEKQYIPVPHQIICTTKNIYFCDTKHSCDTKCSSVPHPSTYVAKNTYFCVSYQDSYLAKTYISVCRTEMKSRCYYGHCRPCKYERQRDWRILPQHINIDQIFGRSNYGSGALKRQMIGSGLIPEQRPPSSGLTDTGCGANNSCHPALGAW